MIYSGINAFVLSTELEGSGSIDYTSEDFQDDNFENDALAIPNHLCLPDMQVLLSEPLALKVDLSEETDRLKEVCCSIRWII